YLRSRAHRGAAALFGAWLAYEVAVELNFSWLPITLPFWFVAAAAIAVWHPTPTTERVAAEGLGRLRVAAAAMVCLGALAAAAIATSRPLLADMYFYAGLADQQRGQFLAARIETSRAQSLAPWQSVYAVRAGDQALAVRVGDAPGRGADLDAALADYEEASRLGTSQPAAYRRLAITAAALGRRNEAIAAAREAVSLGPFDSTNRVLLTEILQAR
ncbi:MAG TPA: hypothetical protein VJU79_05165, partial [Candidatus Dormibacteraeota bacterium]|nr:hypothetical protein [Candidatus Dormibacteraeota bacterium]